MPRTRCGQRYDWDFEDNMPPGLLVSSLFEAILAPTTSQIPPSSASARMATSLLRSTQGSRLLRSSKAHREAQGSLGQARPPAVLPAYLRLRAAGERRQRSAPPAEAHGAGRASGSESGRSRAPGEANALPAAETREPKPLRGRLSERPACATAAATNAPRATSRDS